jgi:hypothetical protein
VHLPRDRNLIVLALLLVLGTATYFTLENSNGYVGGIAELDGYYYYVYLRSLQMDRDLDFTNEYRDWANPFSFGQSPTGRQRNIFGIGPALLWAPFFLLAHLLALIGVKLGFPLSIDGLSRFHQTVTFYSTMLYGWLALLICYRIVKDTFGREHALWAALGAALAGPLPFYCLTWSSYSHAQATMATSLLVMLWLRWRDAWTRRRWLGFGAVAGLVMLVRPACIGFMILPLIEGARAVWPSVRARDGRAALRAVLGPLLGAAAAVVVFSPQLVVWKILFGRFFLVPQGSDFMLWRQTAWAECLFSPRNGLLTNAPLMSVAVLGLVIGVRRRRAYGPALLVAFCAVLLVNGSAYDWWGWGFSARRFTEAMPLFAFGLAAALAAARERLAARPARTAAWITGLLVLGAIVFNLQWMLNFSQRNMDWYGIRSTEGLYMTVTHSLLERVYSTTGNPLSLPSSLAFTVRRGGSPRIYDRIDGSYLLGESHPEANPAAKPDLHATFDFGDLRFRYFMSDSFGYPMRVKGIRFVPLREPRGHVFLPLNRVGPLQMIIGVRAVRPGTKLEVVFNRHSIARRDVPHDEWLPLSVEVPGRHVDRGINRLDLIHTVPPEDPGPRCIGRTGVCSRVDIGVVSGGPLAGNFAEVWVSERKVSTNARGLNVAVIDPASGKLLGRRAFDVYLYRSQFRELERYLRFFPRGSVVAIAMRGESCRYFGQRGREAFSLLGAKGESCQGKNAGYVALGVLGGGASTAVESTSVLDHARARVGIPPPPWREIAHYRAIRLY